MTRKREMQQNDISNHGVGNEAVRWRSEEPNQEWAMWSSQNEYATHGEQIEKVEVVVSGDVRLTVD